MGSYVFQLIVTCSTIIVLLLFLNPEPCVGQTQRVQYLQLFNTTQLCAGRAMANLTADSTVRYDNVTALQLNGMWGIIGKVNGSLEFNKVVHINNDGACIQIQPSNITFVDRYGDLDLALSQIHLFILPSFEDAPWVATPFENQNPPFISVRSWAFSGNHSWTLYEGNNHSGKRICLQPSSQVRAKGYGFTDAADSLIDVRSIRYGCFPGNGGSGLITNGWTFVVVVFVTVFSIAKNI